MAAVFQNVLMRVALWGVAISLAVLVFRSEFVRGLAAALLEKWKRLTALGRAVVCSFLIVGFLVADKTNGVNNLPPQQMLQGGGSFQTGFPGLSGSLPHTPSSLNPVNLVNPVQNNFAQWKVGNWNVRGAWKDSFWLCFEDGWVFPWGTNHLSGVEVVSCGQIWPTPFDTNAVASICVPVEIVPGLTTFAYEHTPSNSYRIVWTDAAVNRDTNDLVIAAIELFRNGDISVATNGVVSVLPRELPFPHSGFGQDEAWVAANFTNAAEIAVAGGYAAWVDVQVGEGLTNGLYKFTATIPDDPPEAAQLVVGDLSVAVTNAGEYVFLLEKGVDYEYGIIPFMTNVSYSAVDDVPQMRGGAGGLRLLPGDAVRAWSVDGGYGNEPQTDSSLGIVWWMPLFFGSPDVSQHLGPGEGPLEFTANLADCRAALAATYSWSASEGLTVHSPSAQTTLVSVESMPSWAQAGISVTASIGDHELYSHLDGFTYGTNSAPQVHLSLSLPSVLIVRGEWMSGSRSSVAQVNFSCDIETNGVLLAWLDSGANKVLVELPGAQGFCSERYSSLSFVVDGVTQSDSAGDVRVGCAFVDEAGVTNATAFATTTVVSPKRVSVPSAPEAGLCVVRGATVSAALIVEPNVEVEAKWQTAKRKTKADYDPWVLRETGSQNAALAMSDAGVFALRAVTVGGGGCQSNAVEYVHVASEPYVPAIQDFQGPCKAGDKNHVGVASTQQLLDIRNAALAHLNQNEYGFGDWLLPRNGFSMVKSGRWKCNAFVADVAIAAGVPVPALYTVHHEFMSDSLYPPSANDWALGTTPITGWLYLGQNAYPEPGFIAGHPNPGGIGHCGIVDYDGWTISARRDGVCRNADKMLDGTCGYNKPTENNDEN